MDTLNLYSEDENESEINAHPSHDSLSPTPSPQPSHHHLQFMQGAASSSEIQQFGPLSPMSKGVRRGRKGSEQIKNMNRGHWSTQENKKYHWFLEIHYTHFVNRHMRRMDKIFKTMELFIGTRQAEQCRSHHQKMEKKYLNFTTIISNLRKMHYNTLDIEPILHEITAFGVSAQDGLATIEHLMEQQSLESIICDLKDRKRSSSFRAEREQAKEMKEQFNPQLHHIEEQKSQQLHCFSVNMLQQCSLNIGELSLYHKEEENSSIFNSLFL